ncbi:MAG TPA: hypothetical protein VFV41_11100 [Streptosporangiaceae bacterium]|nr:hypothetical protein [Streptosporangiaceae bacterium]
MTDNPSWPRVIATTVHLWLARRVGREPAITGGSHPDGQRQEPAGGSQPAARRPKRRRRAVVFGVAIIVVAAGALTIAVAQRAGHRSARGSAAAGQLSPSGPAQAAAIRRKAANWIAAQVRHSAIVACDPVMCAALQAHGFPAGNLLPLSSDAPDPMGSQLVVATAAVRSQFGSRLAGVYAPAVIASFGTGAARVDLRVEAPDGSQAYLVAQRADQLARQAAGRHLLRSRALHVAGASRLDLATGRVDSRLLLTLAALTARQHKVYISTFGEAGPHAAPGVPLRMVRIAALASGHGPHHGAYLHAVLRFLRAQRAPFRGSVTVVHAGARILIQLRFPAPAPLGLLGAHAKP